MECVREPVNTEVKRAALVRLQMNKAHLKRQMERQTVTKETYGEAVNLQSV